MKQGKFDAESGAKGAVGFSLAELLVTLVIAMVLMAIGLPMFLRAYHMYQLSDAATRVAGILRLTRYEAIGRNKTVDCVIQISASDPTRTNMWSNPDRDGTLDPTEKMESLGPGGNLVDPGGVPGTSSLISKAVNGATTVTPSPTSSKITFDARGVVTSANVNVFYLASPIAPEAGYRAVFLMPAGGIEIWSSDTTGNWQQLR